MKRRPSPGLYKASCSDNVLCMYKDLPLSSTGRPEMGEAVRITVRIGAFCSEEGLVPELETTASPRLVQGQLLRYCIVHV